VSELEERAQRLDCSTGKLFGFDGTTLQR